MSYVWCNDDVRREGVMSDIRNQLWGYVKTVGYVSNLGVVLL